MKREIEDRIEFEVLIMAISYTQTIALKRTSGLAAQNRLDVSTITTTPEGNQMSITVSQGLVRPRLGFKIETGGSVFNMYCWHKVGDQRVETPKQCVRWVDFLKGVQLCLSKVNYDVLIRALSEQS